MRYSSPLLRRPLFFIGAKHASTGMDSPVGIQTYTNIARAIVSNATSGSIDAMDGVIEVKHALLKRKRSFKLFLNASSPGEAYVLISKKSVGTTDAHLCADLQAMILNFNVNDNPGNENSALTLVERLVVIVNHETISLPAIQLLRSNAIGLITPQALTYGGSVASNVTDQPGIVTGGAAPWRVALQKKNADKVEDFALNAPFPPSVHQMEAVQNITQKVTSGRRFQTLLGATGTGKTFMVANIIAEVGRPTLVLAPNKVLAAQLANELREFFPKNAVEFFVSYYDYYLPEAYRSSTDTYIDKVVAINEDIDRMRHSATRSLLERNDVVVVSSVSCIYGLGMPAHYASEAMHLREGDEVSVTALTRRLTKLSYVDADSATAREGDANAHTYAGNSGSLGVGRGQYQVSWSDSALVGLSGDDARVVIELGPASDDFNVVLTLQRLENDDAVPEMGDVGGWSLVDISRVNRKDGKPITTTHVGSGPIGAVSGSGSHNDESHGRRKTRDNENADERMSDMELIAAQAEHLSAMRSSHMDLGRVTIYPASHHVLGTDEKAAFLTRVENELEDRYVELTSKGHVLEAQRLRQRTEADLLMFRALGTCKGVENYSRHLAGREAGCPPDCLVDYFPDDWLLVVDESHITVPQVRSMYFGDRSRKLNLVKHGFRLPSALDNRPLQAEEFWMRVKSCLFTSATPGRFEASCAGVVGQVAAMGGKSQKSRVLTEALASRDHRARVANIQASIRAQNISPNDQTLIESEQSRVDAMIRHMDRDQNDSALALTADPSSVLSRSGDADRTYCYLHTGMTIDAPITIDAVAPTSTGNSNGSGSILSLPKVRGGDATNSMLGDDVWWDAEVVIRPTGILDPVVHVRPSGSQIDDLLGEIKTRSQRQERVLVTCLTIRMAEDLSLFLQSKGIKSTYLHSGVKPMQRLEVIRSLRRGEVDVIVGVNLLREGLNLPEVSLVAILDADKEGFLRSDTALIQTIGRASRNVKGCAVLYADRMTGSMLRAISETDRRRRLQVAHNFEHGLEPAPAYATTTEDSILSMVELQSLLEGRTQVSSSEVQRLTAKLKEGRMAYGLTEEEEATNSYRFNSDTPDKVLEELATQAHQDMLAAALDRKYEVAARVRDIRDALREDLQARKATMTISDNKRADAEVA